LAAVADSMAVAAASGIDEERYRMTGEVVIDPRRATSLGSGYADAQDVDLTSLEVSSDGTSVSVRLEAELKLGLIGVFVDQSEPLTVTARASAVPVLVP
jgi:hypothetical protein